MAQYIMEKVDKDGIGTGETIQVTTVGPDSFYVRARTEFMEKAAIKEILKTDPN